VRQSMQIITPADEALTHQIPETFATIAHADSTWTESLWGCVAAKDGSIQIDTGMKKFTNRNIFEAFGGVSRGTEQWTVRSSRRLDRNVEWAGSGPVSDEVIEPLKEMRYTMAENDVIPGFSYDLTLRAVMPPFLEDKDAQREPQGYRVCSDLLRYNQVVTAEGFVQMGDDRYEATHDTWLGWRGHSWGVRMDVGVLPPDMFVPDRMEQNFLLSWGPLFLTRPDGSNYEVRHHVQEVDGEITYFSGYENREDGTQEPFASVDVSDLEFDPETRRFKRGRIVFDCGWGKTRTFEIEAVSDTGFALGTGLYYGFKGRHQGKWVGEEFNDGEKYEDIADPEILKEVHQIRDIPVKVREGDAEGYGIYESIAYGQFPKWGLTGESFR
jgi:hypothetical protein